MDEIFIKFDNIQFNASHISTLKMEDFVKENTGRQFANRGDGEKAALETAYKLCVEACPPAKQAKVKESNTPPPPQP